MRTETICFSVIVILLTALLWYEQHESNRNLTDIIKAMQNPSALCAVQESQMKPQGKK